MSLQSVNVSWIEHWDTLIACSLSQALSLEKLYASSLDLSERDVARYCKFFLHRLSSFWFIMIVNSDFSCYSRCFFFFTLSILQSTLLFCCSFSFFRRISECQSLKYLDLSDTPDVLPNAYTSLLQLSELVYF